MAVPLLQTTDPRRRREDIALPPMPPVAPLPPPPPPGNQIQTATGGHVATGRGPGAPVAAPVQAPPKRDKSRAKAASAQSELEQSNAQMLAGNHFSKDPVTGLFVSEDANGNVQWWTGFNQPAASPGAEHDRRALQLRAQIPGNTTAQRALAGGGGAGIGAGMGGDDDPATIIWRGLQTVLSGENSAFSPEAVKALRNDAFRTARGRASAEQDALAERLIGTGMSRSGMAVRGAMDIERGASAQVGQRFNEINIQKAVTDAEQKMQALNSMENWLRAREDAVIRREGNAIQKEANLAQIRLGYAQIDAQKEMAAQQIAASRAASGAGASLAREQFEYQKERDNRTINIGGVEVPVWQWQYLFGG